jgi:hypothetical protein
MAPPTSATFDKNIEATISTRALSVKIAPPALSVALPLLLNVQL